MSTMNTAAGDKNECHPTVLSQTFADAMPVHSTSNNFWDAFVLQQQQQQQQQQLGQNYPTFNKPIGNISQDFNHEYNPDAALLAVSASQRLGIHDLAVSPNLSLFMPCHQKSVIKDDVFLAQPSSHPVDIDDNASLSSHSTLSSFQPSLTSPYCLSPVSSPTHFLYNHEPLFEGGIIETQDRPVLDYEGGDETYDDFSSAMTGSTLQQQEQCVSTNMDLDWLKLLDAFHADVASDVLASTSETAVIEDDKGGVGLNDLEDYVFSNDTVPGSTNNKRKRVTKPQSSQTTTNAAAKKPRQKRQKKTKITVKRQLKMKMPKDDAVVVSNDAEFIQKPTSSSSDNKEEFDDDAMDQNKETQNHLTDSAVNNNDNRTVFQQLTDASVDWCRYCGTTEGVNWRPGPWGKRTLCNKHGCDYKGYGLASRLPRLDLSIYMDEKIQDRIRPIVQEFCLVCQCPDLADNNQLIHCQGGCSRAYHPKCHKPSIKVDPSAPWYCGASCKENRQLKQVVVDLPRNHLPFMQSSATKSKKNTAV